MPIGDRVAALRHRWTARRIILAAAAFVCAVLLVLWVTGGLAPARERDLVTAHAGQVVGGHPLQARLGPARAVTADEKHHLPTMPGQRYLVVPATLTMRDPRTLDIYTLAPLLTTDVPGLVRFGAPAARTHLGHAPTIMRADGASPLDLLQPDVPAEVLLVWEQDARQNVPAHLTVTVASATWRVSSLSGEEEYLDATPAAQITVDVTSPGTAGAS